MRLDRREFLRLAGLSALAGSLAPAGHAAPDGHGWESTMTHDLPALPYAYDALEPHYDGETVRVHHDTHHAGYVKGLNAAIEQVQGMLDEGNFAAAKSTAKALAFHGSGHMLHSIFWTNMKPGGGGEPTGHLEVAIAEQFGGLDRFSRLFLATANSVEGSGWGILAYGAATGELAVLQAEKHENLAAWGFTPILVVDVWEHAYYLKYRNRRPEWTQAFMEHLVNWDDVARRLAHLRK
jgi:Fe-Mn family superoxide dismutase